MKYICSSFQTGQQEFQVEAAKRETALTVKDDRGPSINLAVSKME